MSRIQKGMLVVAVISILLCIAGTTFVMFFGAKLKTQSAGSQQVQSRAKTFAKTHTQQDCLNHAILNAKKSKADISATIDNQMFLSTCIKFATKTSGFCDESPTTKSITQVIKQRDHFQKKVCKNVEDKDREVCRSLVPMITPYCYQETVIKKQPK